MEKVAIDDFCRYRFLSGLAHSPDGKHACFIVHQCDLEENGYKSDLWSLDILSGQYRRLTTSGTVKHFIWLDEEQVLFTDSRSAENSKQRDEGDEFTPYYKISLYGGEAIGAFTIPRKITSIRLLGRNKYIVVSEYNGNQNQLEKLGAEEKRQELKARKEEKEYEVLEEIPFWANGGGFTSRIRHRLYEFDAVSGEINPVTDEYTSVETYHVNQAAEKVVYVANRFQDKMELVNAVFVYDAAGGLVQEVLPPAMRYYNAYLLSNDEILFTASDMKAYGRNQNRQFYRYKLNAAGPECLTPELDLAVNNAIGSDCRFGASVTEQVWGNRLYFVSTEGGNSFLNRLDRTGKMVKMTEDCGSVDGISIRDDSVLFIGMRKNKLQEIHRLTPRSEQQVTEFNEWVPKTKKLAQLEELHIETEEGVTVDGWVMKPADFSTDITYPAILNIHGGPKAAYGWVFFHEMQYWTSEGYAVFFCNPRGSEGKGNAFADIRGRYGTVDYDDIMRFTDAVLEKYRFIDRTRVGVTGGSYGGFMTNWIIGHTNRFRAAASQRSIANWISKFCTTDIGYSFVDDQIAATPWNNPEKLWEHSPLKYADKVETPTLFLHSDQDYRCWLAEGIQMFTALKYWGVDTRLCLFKGENHELSRSGKPKHRLRRLKEITEWFAKYL